MGEEKSLSRAETITFVRGLSETGRYKRDVWTACRVSRLDSGILMRAICSNATPSKVAYSTDRLSYPYLRRITYSR